MVQVSDAKFPIYVRRQTVPTHFLRLRWGQWYSSVKNHNEHAKLDLWVRPLATQRGLDSAKQLVLKESLGSSLCQPCGPKMVGKQDALKSDGMNSKVELLLSLCRSLADQPPRAAIGDRWSLKL